MALPMQRCWSRLRAVTLPWPAAGYHAKPLNLNLSGVYIPDPEDPKTKEWHKGPAYEAKLYGKYGSISGVKPEQLWPSPEQLQALEDEEKEWYPSLREMQAKVEAEEKALRMKEQERERLIAANMKKMPKMVEEWRRAKREARQKAREENAKKQHLLALAREKFGVSIDSRSARFQEMVKEMEKEEKRKLKAVKRIQREEEKAAIAKALNVASAAKPPTAPDSGSPE
ncbi:PREDICTED: growth arrest and DNA damage-inducible proteins-interacting protein 1 [Nanorana parkeri]|uniref:growth arrest and DNA damage-inducible proteins-interacting protein 1 n=1 Tax=Nanorana parkeri TaxID=125878 RepID=UPI000854ACF4|nr:PREDICTED: growth arrest and DNA damage-inducible proteins-interacting protein 1 [Nanorana parkeri]